MTNANNIPIEQHPLEPFLPSGAKILMLGSFPPKRNRWSMEFFYPNRQNDMWRLMGLIFYGNREHFLTTNGNFDKLRIVSFCTEKGIALYDTASAVRRLKDNASDKFLEVVTPTDIAALLQQIPQCSAIVTTGQRATEVIVNMFGCEMPKVGGVTDVVIEGRTLQFWRMPSSSRAYPLALEKKAEAYKEMLLAQGVLQI